jgi:two-component system, OmpR family, osmolarity sensor histidine kinase EnvZ
MLKSLRARNVALLVGIVLLGQLLAVALLYMFAIRPQAERVAEIMARNVSSISDVMDILPPQERATLISRLNQGGAIRILDGNMEPPEDRGVPTLLERLFLESFAREMQDKNVIIWRGGLVGQLWVQVTLGGQPYWISYERPSGWTLNRALFASFLTAVAMALLAGLLIQRRIAQPLKALAAAADATDRDALPAPLPEAAPTELAAVATSFNAMRDRLEQQDSRRTHMLAAISHDLRTPLAKIRLELAMVPQVPAESEAMITRQLDRLDAMLAQFLDFGRGADSEQVSAFDVAGLLHGTIEDLGIECAVEVQPGNMVLAKPLATRRAIANILRNAEIYGAPPIEICVRHQDAHCIITIRDHGKGVSEADLSRLSEPFFRTDGARNVTGGSGLGFAIAKEAAAAQGGWLRARNAPDGGLIVELAMPATQQPE